MKFDRTYLIRRAVIFFIFLNVVIVYPALDPLFHDPAVYYITYVRDAREAFYGLILYPSAFFFSGMFCTKLRNTSFIQSLPIGMIPDFLVFFSKIIKAAHGVSVSDLCFFGVKGLFLLYIWMLGALTFLGMQCLIALVRADWKSYQRKRKDRKHFR